MLVRVLSQIPLTVYLYFLIPEIHMCSACSNFKFRSCLCWKFLEVPEYECGSNKRIIRRSDWAPASYWPIVTATAVSLFTWRCQCYNTKYGFLNGLFVFFFFFLYNGPLKLWAIFSNCRFPKHMAKRDQINKKFSVPECITVCLLSYHKLGV